jgi:hypothetical protein
MNEDQYQDGPSVPFIKDETELKATMMTPDTQRKFEEITRDMVLSNHKNEDVDFLRATENIIQFVRVIQKSPTVAEDLRRNYPNSNPFDEVLDSFSSEMAILVNASRGVDGKGAQILFTQILKQHRRFSGDEKGYAKGFFTKKDDEDGE